MNSIEKARSIAVRAHGEQKYGEHPYSKHLDDVAALCIPYGAAAQIVAYLHDALEDTSLPPKTVEDEFGDVVRAAVEALTDPPGQNRKERKAAAYAALGDITIDSPVSVALVVKAADRLANVRACVEDENAGLLEMYRKEHPAFVKAVRRIGLNEALVMETTMLLGATDTSGSAGEGSNG